MTMSDHEERLRIMALALRKGIEVRGPEAVSILEDAADFIEFMYAEVYGEEIVGTSDETIGNSAVGSVSSGNASGETSPEGEINGQ